MLRKIFILNFIIVSLILYASSLFAEDSVESLNFSGKVVDSNGVPIANVRVYAYLREYRDGEDRIVEDKMTGSDGSFSFTGLVSPSERHGHYVFIATAPDFAIGWVSQQKSTAKNVVISLAKPGSISGRVIDKEGRPIEGVTVRALGISYVDFLYLPDTLNLASSITDWEGKFIITNLPQSATVSLSILHEKYARTADIMKLGNIAVGAEGLEFTLGLGGIIQGQVRFQDTGKPADGVSVFCQGIHPASGWGRSATDTNGKYVLRSLSPGNYNVCVDIRDNDEWTAIAREAVNVAEGGTVDNVDLYLIKGGYITGKVVDIETNEPISGVGIGIYGPARPESGAAIQSVYTGKDGVFKFHGPPGRNKVYVYDCTDKYIRPQDSASRYVEIKSSEVISDVNFELKPGIVVAGQVIDNDGVPVSGAEVIARPKQGRTIMGEKTGMTDAEGRFHITGLPSDGIIELKAFAKELGASESEKISLGKESINNVILKLKHFTQIRLKGRVLDDTGSPVHGVSINLNVSQPEGGGIWRGHYLAYSTDERGEFLFERLNSESKYSLTAQKPGYQFKTGGNIKKEADGNLNAEDIIMIKLTRFVAGHVLNSTGEPVRDALVFVFNQKINPSLKTDASGYFKLTDLPEGEIWVGAMFNEKEYGCTKVVSENEEIEVRLENIPEKTQDVPTRDDKELAVKIVEEAWKTSDDNYYARSHLAALLVQIDVEQAISMVKESGNEWTKVILGYTSARLPSKDADKILKFLEKDLPVERMVSILSYVAMGQSGTDPQRAKAAYEKAKELLADKVENDVSTLIALASAAKTLGLPEWHDFLEKAYEKVHSMDDDRKRAFCESIYPLDPVRASELADSIKNPDHRRYAKSEIVGITAAEDLIKARELYEALINESDTQSNIYIIGKAGKNIVRQMCKKNLLEEALEFTKRIPESHYRTQALIMVADAMSDSVQVERVYETAVISARASRTTGALPKVIKSMRSRYPDKALALAHEDIRKCENDDVSSREVFELAYYIGDIAPNTGRTIIEKEIAKVISEGSLATDAGQQRLQAASMAMARVDFTRALQIARSITASTEPSINRRAETLRKLAQYLLANEETRRNLAFDRWSASDTWTPGEETDW